jgi:hypothetical protein
VEVFMAYGKPVARCTARHTSEVGDRPMRAVKAKAAAEAWL